MSKSKTDFEAELERWLTEARSNGAISVDIRAGDLHLRVGDYPGPDHRMPVCCGVMRQYMQRFRADIIASPPKGNGASLTIRFYLQEPV